MKCVVCGRETGASWKRYCYTHWLQAGGRSGRRARSSGADTSMPSQPTNQQRLDWWKRTIMGYPAGWVAFFASVVLVLIAASATTLVVYDQQQASQPTMSAPARPPGATALCNDGTYSYSQHRRGTCSHHGGVRSWLADIPP